MPFEVALTWAAVSLIRPLPRRAVLRLADFLGWLGYHLAGRLRDVAFANLDVVFGQKISKDEKDRILRQSTRNVALVALDSIWFSHRTAERVRQWVHTEVSLKAVFPEGSPAICLTGHFGNWEILGHVAALAGYPLASVATPLKNRTVDHLLRQAREVAGQIIIEREGAVRKMLQILRRKGRVALLLDQNTSLMEGGIFVDFFNVPATMSPAAAALALRTQSRIVFGFSIPQADGSYGVFSPAVLEPPPFSAASADRQAAELTQHIAKIFEQAILDHPECWLWMYKRWKHVRPGDDRARYPFYTSELRPDLIPPSYRYEST
jgi:KDO2-lipid IV(A) lauroyltransferase